MDFSERYFLINNMIIDYKIFLIAFTLFFSDCTSRWWYPCTRYVIYLSRYVFYILIVYFVLYFVENTLSAIKKGCEYGIHAVEFDVMLSKDRIPMLMHDEVLLRTLNNDCIHKNKIFNTLTSTELESIDVGSWYSKDYKDERIPTFESIIQYCIVHKIFMNIEIKPVKGDEMITGQIIAEMIRKYYNDLKDNNIIPLFSSFSYDALKAAKDTFSLIPRGFLIDEPIDSISIWKEQAQELDIISLHLNHKYITTSNINDINHLGFNIFCYTVNDIDRAKELLELGIDAFCTDKIDEFSNLAQQLN